MVQVAASGVCLGTSFCTAITPVLVLLLDKCELVGLAKSSAAVQFFSAFDLGFLTSSLGVEASLSKKAIGKMKRAKLRLEAGCKSWLSKT